MAKADATARKVDPQAKGGPSAEEAGIDAVMRELLQKKPSQGSLEKVNLDGVAQPGAPRRDFDMATELLDRASQAFDLLINRCQTLEYEFYDANERNQAHAAEQDEAIEQWMKLAGKFKAQLEITEEAMASLRKRCDVVEARAARAEKQVKLLEAASLQAAEQAAVADQLSIKLHDKVVAAFGIGSRAHPVLDAVATRAVAE